MTKHSPSDDIEHDSGEEQLAEQERIRAMRARIARGDYRPDPEAIARRILERDDLDPRSAQLASEGVETPSEDTARSVSDREASATPGSPPEDGS